MLFHSRDCSHALNRRKLDYTVPAWQPWLSNTNISCLYCLQDHSLRSITGQLVSKLLEALRLEADVQSYPTCSNRLILKAREKALHSTDDHPKSISLDANIPQRLQNRSSFHQKAEELSTILSPNLKHRQDIIHFPPPPWQNSSPHEGRIATTVPGITDRANDTNLKLQCSLTAIASYQAITSSTLMDPLEEGQETGMQQQLSLGDPLSRMNWSPPLKQKVEHLPAPMRRKQLSWNQHYPGHPPTTTSLQYSYYFALTVSFILSSNIVNPQFHQLHIVFHLHSMDSWSFCYSR